MSRLMYDRAAVEWAAVVDAVRKAGGDTVTLPALHLTLIMHGYRQLQQERAAALALVEQGEANGYLDNTHAAAFRHALGELSDDAYAEHVRAASNHQTEEGK